MYIIYKIYYLQNILYKNILYVLIKDMHIPADKSLVILKKQITILLFYSLKEPIKMNTNYDDNCLTVHKFD